MTRTRIELKGLRFSKNGVMYADITEGNSMEYTVTGSLNGNFHIRIRHSKFFFSKERTSRYVRKHRDFFDRLSELRTLREL